MNQSPSVSLADGNDARLSFVSSQAGAPASAAPATPVFPKPILTEQARQHGMLASASAEAGRSAVADSAAGKGIAALDQSLGGLNRAAEVDLAGTMDVMRKLKWSQKEGHFHAMSMQSPPMARMREQLCMFLHKLVAELADGRLSLASLDVAGVHLICNGLSACLGADRRDCLFDAGQLAALGKKLRLLNRELIVQAMKKGLPAHLQAHGLLINILNLQSRGLKHGLFKSSDSHIRALFVAALDIMKQWPLQSHTPGLPLSDAGRLDMRQLGKCMVQLNAMLKYELIAVDGEPPEGRNPRDLLGDVALGLCAGVPHGFVLWRRSAERHWELVTVQPQAVPVSNIVNTVKDFVAAGLMPVSAPALPGLVGTLLAWMRTLPQEDMLDRGGQSLANCANFLRALTEPGFRGVVPALEDAAVFHDACQRTLRLAEDLLAGRPGRGALQTLVNLVSFVKAMDKLGGHDQARLAPLARRLLEAVAPFVDAMTGDSISGLLAGLVYFSRRQFGEAGQMYPLLGALVGMAVTRLNQFSSVEARASLIEGILLHLAVTADHASRPPCLAALETLLHGYHDGCERLPYLKAARCLLAAGSEPAGLQQVLRRLLNRADGKVLGLAEIDAALTALKADGPLVPNEPMAMPPEPKGIETPASSKPKPLVAEPKRPGPTYRAPTPVATGNARGSRPAAYTGTTTTTATGRFGAMPATTVASGGDGMIGRWWEEEKAPAAPPSRAGASHIGAPGTQAARTPEKDDGKHGMPRASGMGGGALGPAADGRRPKAGAKSDAAAARGAAAPASPVKPVSAEEEWFSRLMQPGSESLEKLKKMAKAKPALLEASIDHGQGKRGGLYLALAGGKPGVVAWLKRAVPSAAQPEPKAMLDMLFSDNDVVLIDRRHKDALRQYLQLLPRQQRRQVLEAFMPRLTLVPAGYREVLDDGELLASVGLSRPIPEAIIATPKEAEAGKTRVGKPARGGATADATTAPVDEEGNTALMTAVLNRQLDTVRTLLTTEAHRGQATRVNHSGDIPLHCAINMGSTAIASALLEMPSARLQVELRDAEGRNALNLAISCGRRAEVDMLLAMDSASEQATAINIHGNNGLMIAAMYGLADIARKLLALPSARDQAKVVNRDGYNARMIALLEGHNDIARMLADMQ